MTNMRSVIAAAKLVRGQPNSARIGFIRTENVTDDAACALIASTPMKSAVHARHDSPSGPDRSGVEPVSR